MADSTIRLSPNATFWVLFLSLALMGLLIFSDILLPFVAGLVLAYLFQPFVARMERWGINRGLGAFIVIAAGALIAAVIIAVLIPPVVSQATQLIENWPRYYQEAREYILKHYGGYIQQVAAAANGGEQSKGPLSPKVTQDVASWLLSRWETLLQSGMALFNSLALLFLTPVIVFFLLRDWDKMLSSIQEFLPKENRPTIRKLAGDIDTTISGYLRGMLTVLSILSAFYMLALSAIGLNYGLIIGLFAGMFSFVPYLGSTSGFLIATGVAAYQFWPEWQWIAAVCAVFIIGQVVEGNVLTPKIVGDKVQLHPVWLLFALIAAAYLFGFAGLLIGVPLAAVIGVLVRFVISKYYKSEMHEGEESHARKEEPVRG